MRCCEVGSQTSSLLLCLPSAPGVKARGSLAANIVPTFRLGCGGGAAGRRAERTLKEGEWEEPRAGCEGESPGEGSCVWLSLRGLPGRLVDTPRMLLTLAPQKPKAGVCD